MKAQTKALLASIVVIALALTAVSGVTYSWFSDTEKAEIDVSTAKIDVDGIYGDPTVKKTSNSASVSDTTVSLSEDKKKIEIQNFLADRTVSATYTLTNKSTVDTVYWMYVSVSGISDDLAKKMISVMASSGNELTLNEFEFIDGKAYIIGGADKGITLPKATDAGTEYQFSVSIVSDMTSADISNFKIEIVNEAYQSDYIPTVTTQTGLESAISRGDDTIPLGTGTFSLPSLTGKSVTFIGSGDATVIDMKEKVLANAESLVFKNLKYEAGTSDYKGFQHTGTLTYEDCTITGKSFLYATTVSFKDCKFVQDAVDYSIWTYGASTVDFTDCTFDCKGKAVLIYSESDSLVQTVDFKDCKFNASQPVTGKAAIEIDSSYGPKYTVDIVDCEVTGFGNGSDSGNSLWNVKKQSTSSVPTITVDGQKVYPTA